MGCKTDGKPSQPPWWLAGFTHVSITKDVTCNISEADPGGGGGGGGLGVATPPFGNAPSSAKQPLPFPRFLYRA